MRWTRRRLPRRLPALSQPRQCPWLAEEVTLLLGPPAGGLRPRVPAGRRAQHRVQPQRATHGAISGLVSSADAGAGIFRLMRSAEHAPNLPSAETHTASCHALPLGPRRSGLCGVLPGSHTLRPSPPHRSNRDKYLLTGEEAGLITAPCLNTVSCRQETGVDLQVGRPCLCCAGVSLVVAGV